MTEQKSARQHARERGALDGADAQALEGALTMTERERDEWRSECASISEEFNLPAGIRPSEGEVSRFLKDYEKARNERDEAREELARSEQTIDAQDSILTAKYNGQLSRARDAERERDEALAKYQFMVDGVANEKLDGYRELASRLAAMEAERDKWRKVAEANTLLREDMTRQRDEALAALNTCDPPHDGGRVLRPYSIPGWGQVWSGGICVCLLRPDDFRASAEILRELRQRAEDELGQVGGHPIPMIDLPPRSDE